MIADCNRKTDGSVFEVTLDLHNGDSFFSEEEDDLILLTCGLIAVTFATIFPITYQLLQDWTNF